MQSNHTPATTQGPVLPINDPVSLITIYDWNCTSFDTDGKGEDTGRRWLNFKKPWHQEQPTGDEIIQQFADESRVCGVTLTSDDTAREFLITNADDIRGLSYSYELFELGVVFPNVEFMIVHSRVHRLPNHAATVLPNLKKIINTDKRDPTFIISDELVWGATLKLMSTIDELKSADLSKTPPQIYLALNPCKTTDAKLLEDAIRELQATDPLNVSRRAKDAVSALHAEFNRAPPVNAKSLELIAHELQSATDQLQSTDPLNVSRRAMQLISLVHPGFEAFESHRATRAHWEMLDEARALWPCITMTRCLYPVHPTAPIAVAEFIWLR